MRKLNVNMTPEEAEVWERLRKSPDYPTLRLAAARMLDENPEIAKMLDEEGISDDERVSMFRTAFLKVSRKRDMTKRKRVDRACNDALAAAFRAAGFNGMAYTMASQLRHMDWVDRKPDEPLPDGETLTFFHFTSTVHLPVILRFGIARGDVCIEPDNEEANYNAPWLTTNPAWDGQGWAEDSEDRSKPNSAFDKRAVRLTVQIPKNDPSLSPWEDVMLVEGVPDFWADALNSCGGHEDWFIYNGIIPRPWIAAVEYRDSSHLSLGRVGFMRSLLDVESP